MPSYSAQGAPIYTHFVKFWETIFNIYIAFLVSQDLPRQFFKFQKLRSLLDIAQNILIVHHSDQWGWGLVFLGEFGAKFVQAAMGSCLQFCVAQ